MKWLTLIVGALIIIAGIWLLFSPQSVDSPAGDTEAPGTAELAPLNGAEPVMPDRTTNTTQPPSTDPIQPVDVEESLLFDEEEAPQGGPIPEPVF